MDRLRIFSIAKYYGVAAIFALTEGCTSQSAQIPEPQLQTVRQTSETAPAELQLLCANAATKAFSMAPEKVRPVSSSAAGMGYSVQLDVGGSRVICTVGEEGIISSLDKA